MTFITIIITSAVGALNKTKLEEVGKDFIKFIGIGLEGKLSIDKGAFRGKIKKQQFINKALGYTKNGKYEIRITELGKSKPKLNANSRGIINTNWQEDILSKSKH